MSVRVSACGAMWSREEGGENKQRATRERELCLAPDEPLAVVGSMPPAALCGWVGSRSLASDRASSSRARTNTQAGTQTTDLVLAVRPMPPAALVARVVASQNRQTTDLLAVRPTVTVYRIHVREFADSTRSWCVLRRYSEFRRLRASIARSVRAELPELPALPPKLVMHNSDVLAGRYIALDAFLRSLLSLPAAAAHPRLRSFLGADEALMLAERSASFASTASSILAERSASFASTASSMLAERSASFASSTASPAADSIVEDDWEHESEADEGGPSSERSLPSELWCLGGAWVADEQRSRDSLEPMYKALGTPPPARRLLRGLAITSTLTHDPAKRLVEVSSSRLGAGQPAVFHLDGATRPLWMGRQQGAVRGVELRRTGAVRLEITLPDGRGRITDTRRVLPSGAELERVVELRLPRQPPLRLHRLLVRASDEPPAQRRAAAAAAAEAMAGEATAAEATAAEATAAEATTASTVSASAATSTNGHGKKKGATVFALLSLATRWPASTLLLALHVALFLHLPPSGLPWRGLEAFSVALLSVPPPQPIQQPTPHHAAAGLPAAAPSAGGGAAAAALVADGSIATLSPMAPCPPAVWEVPAIAVLAAIDGLALLSFLASLTVRGRPISVLRSSEEL